MTRDIRGRPRVTSMDAHAHANTAFFVKSFCWCPAKEMFSFDACDTCGVDDETAFDVPGSVMALLSLSALPKRRSDPGKAKLPESADIFLNRFTAKEADGDALAIGRKTPRKNMIFNRFIQFPRPLFMSPVRRITSRLRRQYQQHCPKNHKAEPEHHVAPFVCRSQDTALCKQAPKLPSRRAPRRQENGSAPGASKLVETHHVR